MVTQEADQLWPRGDLKEYTLNLGSAWDQSWPRGALRKHVLFSSLEELEWNKVIESWNSDGGKNISLQPWAVIGKRRLELEEGSNLGYSPKLRKGVVSRKKEEMVAEVDETSEQQTPSTPSRSFPRPLPGSRDKRKYSTPTRRLSVETPNAPKS